MTKKELELKLEEAVKSTKEFESDYFCESYFIGYFLGSLGLAEKLDEMLERK